MPDTSYIEDIFNNNEDEKKKNPLEITKVDPEINRELLKLFTGEHTGFVQVGPQKYFFPSGYEKEAENYYNFEVRPDDTWIITYPRSGTTWTQEMVWLIANGLDYDTAAKVDLGERFPFLEFSMCVHPITKAQFLKENNFCKKRQSLIESCCTEGWKMLQEQMGKRFIKTHLPFSVLPPNLLTSGCKIIYVARNPKDVVVSYYHLNRLFRTQGYIGDFSTFVDYFVNDLVAWSPYWSHIQEGWERRHSKNLLFMSYEQMNKDLQKSIEKVANFLGKVINEEELVVLQNHLKIDNFRNNPSVNNQALKDLGILNSGEQGFVRKGKTGSWKDDTTVDFEKKIDNWIEKNLQKTKILNIDL